MDRESNKRIGRRKFLAGVVTVGASLMAGNLMRDPLKMSETAAAGTTAPSFGINVKDHGVIGDGSADDTAALRSIIQTAVTTGRRLIFPKGIYKITDKIDIPRGESFVIEGESHGCVKIVQFANNKPIFRFTKAFTTEWRISGITFTYNKDQPAANKSAIPIYFDQSTVDSNGFWNFLIEWCKFDRGSTAIATNPDQQMAVWGVTVRHCIFESSISGGYIRFDPNPAVGQPNIELDHIYGWAGDKVEGPLISISIADTVMIKSCEFNHLRCKPFNIGSCANVTVINTRCEDVEAHVASGDYYRFWEFPNSRVNVIGCEITSITVNGGGNFIALSANAGGELNIMGYEMRVAAAGGGSECYAWDADRANLVSQVSVVGAGKRQMSGKPHPRLDADRSTPDGVGVLNDANAKLTAEDYQYQRMPVQTANRTVTLPGDGKYDGLTFTVLKDNTSPFTLAVDAGGAMTTLPGGSRASVTCRCVAGNAWIPIHYSLFP